MLAAIGAVAVALLVSSDGGGSDVQAPDASDVQQQIDELRQFIDENTR